MTLAHKSPIIKSIVFNLIREVHYENFKSSKKYSIDVSLIPSFNENLAFKKGYKESLLKKDKKEEFRLLIPKKHIAKENRNIDLEYFRLKENLALEGYKESIINKEEGKKMQQTQIIAQQLTTSQQKQPSLPSVKTKTTIVPINLMINPPNYGKLNYLMWDKEVSLISCDGPKKPLRATKRGKEQLTHIVLEKQEIMNLLYQISAKTRIPLIEDGVYRVSWDDFIINAIVSEEIEPTFIIKRIEQSHTPLPLKSPIQSLVQPTQKSPNPLIKQLNIANTNISNPINRK